MKNNDLDVLRPNPWKVGLRLIMRGQLVRMDWRPELRIYGVMKTEDWYVVSQEEKKKVVCESPFEAEWWSAFKALTVMNELGLGLPKLVKIRCLAYQNLTRCGHWTMQGWPILFSWGVLCGLWYVMLTHLNFVPMLG